MDPTTDTPTDFTPHRRRYQARQQAMEAAIGPLRARLRERLTARSPELARLAAIDAVMEQVLAVRERHLLSGIPTMLERHFVRLHRHAEPDTTVWLAHFRHDLHAVLRAELELRWQPVAGLLEALRAAPAAPSSEDPKAARRTSPRTATARPGRAPRTP